MIDQPNQRRSLTVQAFSLLLAKTLAFIFAFALPILLTRSLSQNEYGLFKQVFLIITTATALLPLGFRILVRRTPVVVVRSFSTSCSSISSRGSAACLVLLFWPGLTAIIFSDPTISSYAASLGIVVLLWLFSSFLETVAVANQELRLATIFIAAAQITRTILFLAAPLIFISVQALVYAAVIHGVLQSLVLLWYVFSRFPGFWRAFDWSLTLASRLRTPHWTCGTPLYVPARSA
jgi:O-antigen/teichoic acid export membrane protein